MNVVNYIKESYEELSTKMTWIDWSEAQKTTVIVAVFTIIFAIAVFGVDKLFQSALSAFFNLF